MNEKLKQRTKTGVVFGIVVLSLVCISPKTAILFLILVGGLAGGEFLRINNEKENTLPYYLLSIGMVCLSWWLLNMIPETMAKNLVLVSVVINLILVLSLYTKISIFRIAKGFLIHVLYISLPISLMAWHLQKMDQWFPSNNIILVILLLIWSSDSFAYLIGSKIGKTKLFERISPNKTWEGFGGAGVCTLLLAFAISGLFDFSTVFLLWSALICWVFGTYGDLYQSSVKRFYKIKDSGDILPGHGGFYDRFDSFIFVLPFILLLVYYL